MLNLFETHPIELYHLTIVTSDGRRERLGTTGNHPFYEASERRFVPARELRPGCRVVTVTGAIADVEAVEVHTAAAGESFTTYNIEVEEDHTYHVGELGTWVHNESAERCLKLAREAADGSEEAVEELRRIFSKAPELRRSVDGQLREIVDGDLLRRIDAPRVVDAWALCHTDITARLKEHLSHAVRQAKLTPAQARDVIKNGRASKHWGTQIDTCFKELVQNDPLLRGEVAVSPRSLPKGSGAPDVIDLRTKRWWDVTSTAEDFAKKPAKYGKQFGDGASLLYGEP